MRKRVKFEEIAMTNPTFDPATLTSTTDIYGKTLTVGQRVRSFDFPLITPGNVVLGMETDSERAAYVEGVLEAIGNDRLEGCQRYRILVDRVVIGGEDQPDRVLPGQFRKIFPPLNGTPAMFGEVTCGVVAI
jgi:hypothetical protein